MLVSDTSEEKTLSPDNGSERAHCASLVLICIKSAPTQEETWCILVSCISLHHEHDQRAWRLVPSNSWTEIRVYVWLAHLHALLPSPNKAGANTVQLSVSIFTALKPKQQRRKVLFMWSHSHADRYLHVCPLETDVFKMLQENDSAPQGDSIGHKWFWHVVLFLNIEKKKTFTGIDSDADVSLRWQTLIRERNKHYCVIPNRMSPFRVS